MIRFTKLNYYVAWNMKEKKNIVENSDNKKDSYSTSKNLWKRLAPSMVMGCGKEYVLDIRIRFG